MTGPVFVAGCGRSGTSWLRTIVSAHPDVHIPSESLFITDYLRFGGCVPKRLLGWLFFHEPQLLCWYHGGPFDFDDPVKAVEKVHAAAAEEEGAKVWGQKTPRFVRHMELFDGCFPGIRWLLIHRDPRAVAASMKRSGQHTYSVVRACRRWIRDNGIIIDILRGGASPPNVMVLGFEELVTDYDRMLERIFAFLELEPIGREEVNRDGQPVFFDRSRFRINTVRGRLDPDPSMIDGWRGVLSAAETGYVERTCSEGMSVLGYEPPDTPRGETGESFLLQGLADIVIPFRYAVMWPEYLFWSGLRWTALRLFAACRPGRVRRN